MEDHLARHERRNARLNPPMYFLRFGAASNRAWLCRPSESVSSPSVTQFSCHPRSHTLAVASVANYASPGPTASCGAHRPVTRACDLPEIDPASDVSRYLVRPDHAQASRRVSTDLRHSGTPQTALVRDLVRTHTSPRHENGPQAELAGR